MTTRRFRPRTRRAHAQSGFTLVELMIAIVVAGALMAMAAFTLVRARASANEASAIASMKAINQAQLAYNASCGRNYYASSLAILGMPPHEAATAGYIDPELASGAIVEKDGYQFRIQLGTSGYVTDLPDCNGNKTLSSYYATGAPVVVGETGTRAFATNQVGAIWQTNNGVAPTEPFGPPAEIAK